MEQRPARRTTVAAGTGRAVMVVAGGRAHVVNTLGWQVADFWALALPGAASYLSTSHTRLAIGRISPRPGDVLVDNRRQPLLRVLADTSPGGHDTLIPSCDAQRYADLGHDGEHRSCAANFAAAIAAHGLHEVPVPDPVNLFMSVPVAADGSLRLVPSAAGPGSEVVLEALRDVLLVVSACPQDLVPISGAGAAPRQVDLYTG
jgi:uncharacterized protein YcgI (DUF1989 family)